MKVLRLLAGLVLALVLRIVWSRWIRRINDKKQRRYAATAVASFQSLKILLCVFSNVHLA